MKAIQTIIKFQPLLITGVVIVAAIGLVVLIDMRLATYLHHLAIQSCADVAERSEGVFNGAVYKLCVEDKGYTTNVK